jgi:hypothetical protein
MVQEVHQYGKGFRSETDGLPGEGKNMALGDDLDIFTPPWFFIGVSTAGAALFVARKAGRGIGLGLE